MCYGAAMRRRPGRHLAAVSPHPFRLALTLTAIVAAGLLSGCGAGSASGSGAPEVVAAENMWGSIAAQIAGPDARVQSIIVNPAEDPHSYEPTADDARALATASLAVVNGIDYDPWASRLLAADPSSARIVLNVGSLLRVPDGGNPHRWYDPSNVETVARALATDLGRLDPAHRAAYARRLGAFEGQALGTYRWLIAAIRRRYAGVPVGASESIFALLAPALGLRLRTPQSFMNSISEGTDVTAHDAAQVTRQITARAIRVWVFNSQNATPEVAELNALARAHAIPITTITETLTPARASFQQWQVTELQALVRALRQATGR
jgi:zinc/manganese transport system substrate-binding protein